MEGKIKIKFQKNSTVSKVNKKKNIKSQEVTNNEKKTIRK